MDKEMNANELADALDDIVANYIQMIADVDFSDVATMLRQQQAEIDRLNYDIEGFKQNFFVSGFHLQIKMANEQLLKQQEQIDALKSELDRAVELYTDKAIENEALKAEIEALKAGKIRAYDNGVEDGRKPNTNLVKEAKYGITTKWDGITTYHETTEPIGKAQEK